MARNSMAKMVNKASDVDGAVSETNGVEVVGGVVEMASRIGCAVGTGGTDSVGSSSYCLAYGGTGDIGLADAAIGVE